MIKIEKFKDLDTSGVATAGDLGQMPSEKLYICPFTILFLTSFALEIEKNLNSAPSIL